MVIPERWALYQEEHFTTILGNGSHDLGGHELDDLMGDDCGLGSGGDPMVACELGVNTWNYTFMYPVVSYGADPNNKDDPTIENR